jgi:hypothetical protein
MLWAHVPPTIRSLWAYNRLGRVGHYAGKTNPMYPHSRMYCLASYAYVNNLAHVMYIVGLPSMLRYSLELSLIHHIANLHWVIIVW